MVNIKYVDGDDWVGVYFNNLLELEGHYIPTTHLLESLEGLQVRRVELYYADMDWLLENGNFPQDFVDVVLDKND